VAEALDLPLIMAGRIAPKEREFFESEVAPHLDGVKRRYVGEVSGRPKWELYAGARALLFPIEWEEPFGLVMIEAMAAGTPVIATRRGSVPEVVGHGETGVIVDSGDVDAVARATRDALSIAPAACRERVERLFSADKMVDDYVRLYETLLGQTAQEGPPPGIATA
jgi:glycosyltransferase involved in cell wall biosynthesis